VRTRGLGRRGGRDMTLREVVAEEMVFIFEHEELVNSEDGIQGR